MFRWVLHFLFQPEVITDLNRPQQRVMLAGAILNVQIYIMT